MAKIKTLNLLAKIKRSEFFNDTVYRSRYLCLLFLMNTPSTSKKADSFLSISVEGFGL